MTQAASALLAQSAVAACAWAEAPVAEAFSDIAEAWDRVVAA